MKEDMEYYIEDYHFKTEELKKLDIDGMDEAWFIEEDELVQILWLRKGCRMESVEMSIEKHDLKDFVEKYAEDLIEG